MFQIDGKKLHVTGELKYEDSKTHLIANVDGKIFKSSVVDLDGTLHLFTQVSAFLSSHNCVLLRVVSLAISSIN